MKKKVSGSTAVVLGRSKIVGTPAAGDYTIMMFIIVCCPIMYDVQIFKTAILLALLLPVDTMKIIMIII